MSSDDFSHAQELCRGREFSAALPHIRSFLDKTPKHVAAWRLYADALDALGQSDEAADAAKRADVVEAEHTADIGAPLLFHGDTKRSKALFKSALALDADCITAHWLLDDIEGDAGNKKVVIAHYERCLEIAPDRNGPAFMIAALGEDTAPDQAPVDSISDYFDWYAEHFEEHLTDRLNYTGPGHVADVLRAACPGGVGHCIDLGCGTGLAGAAALDMVERLTRVDLSPEMLSQARARGIYETLEEADLASALQARPNASADAILAADVFVYIGNLSGIVAQCGRVLVPGGVFIATVEASGADVETGRLEPSGRYIYSRDYLKQLGKDAGFIVSDISDIILREEYGEPVKSHLSVFTAPEQQSARQMPGACISVSGNALGGLGHLAFVDQRQKGIGQAVVCRLGSRRDELALGHDRVVRRPFRAGAAQILADPRVGGDPAAGGDLGGDQQPDRLADGQDRLFGVDEGRDQPLGVRVLGQRLGAVGTVGNDQAGIVGGQGVANGLVGHEMMAPGIGVPALHQPAVGRDHLHGAALGQQGFLDVGERRLGKAGGGENCDGKFFVSHLHTPYLRWHPTGRTSGCKVR